MCISKNVTDLKLLNFNDLNLKYYREVEILGITLDQNLNLRCHIKSFAEK